MSAPLRSSTGVGSVRALVCLVALAAACANPPAWLEEPEQSMVQLPASDDRRPFFLSQVGLYRDILSKTISTRSIAFTPVFPLWSDGSEKQRWLIVPPGRTIDVRDP